MEMSLMGYLHTQDDMFVYHMDPLTLRSTEGADGRIYFRPADLGTFYVYEDRVWDASDADFPSEAKKKGTKLDENDTVLHIMNIRSGYTVTATETEDSGVQLRRGKAVFSSYKDLPSSNNTTPQKPASKRPLAYDAEDADGTDFARIKRQKKRFGDVSVMIPEDEEGTTGSSLRSTPTRGEAVEEMKRPIKGI